MSRARSRPRTAGPGLPPRTRTRRTSPCGAERRAELVRIEAELLADERVERPLRILEQPGGDRLSLTLREPLSPIEGGHLGLLLLRHCLELGALEGDLALEQLALGLHRDVLARRHAERASQEPGDPGEQDEATLVPGCPGDAHDEREVAHEAVADPENHRAQDPGPPRAVPPFAGSNVVGRAEGPHRSSAVARSRRARARRRRCPRPRERTGCRTGPPRRPRGR